MSALRSAPERTYHVLGVPLRTGSLHPGSENDATAYRDAGLITRLGRAGLQAIDEGDLAIPSYLPHHTVPPIRSWPGPRVVWDRVADTISSPASPAPAMAETPDRTFSSSARLRL